MKVFRWAVRLCSLFFLAFQMTAFEDFQWPAILTTPDTTNLILWGVILLGMALAWMSEGGGGFLIIAGFIIQVAFHPDMIRVWTAWIAPAIGGLFIISWATREEQWSR